MKFSYLIYEFLFIFIVLLLTNNLAIAQTQPTIPSTNLQDSIKIADTTSAQESWNKPWPNSRFSIRAGAFWAINSTQVGIGTNHEPYTDISFENTLGMDKNTYSGLIDVTGRFGKHHRIDLEYYNIYRNASRQIDTNFVFNGVEYQAGLNTSSHLNTNILRLAYGYSFFSNKTFELGALVGFHVFLFDIGIDANSAENNIDIVEDTKLTAPLPDFGIWGTWAFHDRLAISGEIGYFGIGVKYWGLKGEILNLSTSLQIRVTEHFEIDLGYSNFNVLVDIDRKHLQGDFSWDYNGPFANIVYKF